ncbi:polyprenyl synthetase family protein [Patescibacteria group bacterium]|nr:polyprenyl synthetase family protein [Patescibacteria group bacterium]
MDFQKKITKLQKEINKRLEIFFEKKIKETRSISLLMSQMTKEISDQMTKEINNFVLRGGKRIRPILAYYGYFAAGGKGKKAILDAAISIEIIHNYLLIHDDIIDKDEFRRGKPTIHQKYKKIYQRTSKEAEHLGISAGIVAGDLCSSFGYEILTKSKFPDSLKVKALDKLNRIITEVGGGEVLDVFWGIKHKLSRDEIFKILEYKTARYTIEGPLHLGAILAGADKKILKKLSDYAIPLGIAFQIQDDILGMFGDEKKLGKPIGSDLREGKQTLLIFKARRSANRRQRKIIDRALGNLNLTKNQLEKVREIVIKTGSLNFARNLAKKLVSQSKIAIKKSNFPSEVKGFLTELADFIIEREK